MPNDRFRAACRCTAQTSVTWRTTSDWVHGKQRDRHAFFLVHTSVLANRSEQSTVQDGKLLSIGTPTAFKEQKSPTSAQFSNLLPRDQGSEIVFSFGFFLFFFWNPAVVWTTALCTRVAEWSWSSFFSKLFPQRYSKGKFLRFVTEL